VRALMVSVAVAALVVWMTAGAAVAVFMAVSIVGAWWQLRGQRRQKPPRRRRRVWSEDERRFILDRDGWACVRCGSTAELEIDHVIPFSRGGACTVDNAQVLCGPCNRAKGAS
jgi:5-methylcytosine-specific restriction endonuclease McrA